MLATITTTAPLSVMMYRQSFSSWAVVVVVVVVVVVAVIITITTFSYTGT